VGCEAQTIDQQTQCAALARTAFTEIETQRRPEQLKYGNKDIIGTFASYLNVRLGKLKFAAATRRKPNLLNHLGEIRLPKVSM